MENRHMLQYVTNLFQPRRLGDILKNLRVKKIAVVAFVEGCIHFRIKSLFNKINFTFISIKQMYIIYMLSVEDDLSEKNEHPSPLASTLLSLSTTKCSFKCQYKR